MLGLMIPLLALSIGGVLVLSRTRIGAAIAAASAGTRGILRWRPTSRRWRTS